MAMTPTAGNWYVIPPGSNHQWVVEAAGDDEAEGTVVGEFAREDDAVLFAGARDYALLCRGLLAGVVRWEPFYDKERGELCVGGMRYTTRLDALGIPMIHLAIEDAIEKEITKKVKDSP